MREALLYPVQPKLTFILISISVCIFLVQYVSKDQYRQIFDLTVVDPHGLLQHQWWRLLTTTFVHGGLLHLAFNMYALYALGQGAERIWGRGRFLAIYIIAAIGGTCLAMAIQPFPCVGASGAICGIFTGEAAWVFYNRGHLDPRAFSAAEAVAAIDSSESTLAASATALPPAATISAAVSCAASSASCRWWSSSRRGCCPSCAGC